MSLCDSGINDTVRELLSVKGKKDIESKKKYSKLQLLCVKQVQSLVNNLTAKYRSFSNYHDLQQDAFEAMISSLDTFDPNKGDFTWWATKYIKTKVSRSANKHSSIKIPLKKANELRPYKTSTMPILIDNADSPYDCISGCEQREIVSAAVETLPEKHKQLIKLYYGFGNANASIGDIAKQLNISRPTFFKLLEDAQKKLRLKLISLEY